MQWIVDNAVDIAIILMLLAYAYDGWKRGLIVIAVEVLGFVGSLAGALLLYGPLRELAVRYVPVTRGFAKAIGFVAAWTVIAAVYTPLSGYAYRKIPARFRRSGANRFLGGFAAIFDGLLLAAFLASFVVALPFSSGIKKDVVSSRIGGYLVRQTQGWERTMDAVFGGALKESLTFITVRQGSEESVDLRFSTEEFKPDPQAEQRLLDLVNAERTKRGLKPLKGDPFVTKVSRDHSADMLRRGYFSHVDPDGRSPAERGDAAGVRYRIYGENLAYAPDVAIAHDGLMNSPGHRANILSEEYGRIGIGIQDAGIYGLMITQNFADGEDEIHR